MSDLAQKLSQYVTPKELADIDDWINKYPADQKRSAVMQALMIVQEHHGYLTRDQMDAVAEYLDMAPVSVYEVASFYTMYETKPTGKHIISVCTNISCKLRNCAEIVTALEQKLDVTLGQTTTDGRFTLRSVECLGACVYAPMMQIDKTYHENLTVDALDAVLEQDQ